METLQFSFVFVFICYASASIPLLRIVYVNSAQLSGNSKHSDFRIWAWIFVINFGGTFHTLVVLAGGGSLAFYQIVIPLSLLICVGWEIMYFTEATKPQDEEEFLRNLLLTSLGILLWMIITFVALLSL